MGPRGRSIGVRLVPLDPNEGGCYQQAMVVVEARYACDQRDVPLIRVADPQVLLGYHLGIVHSINVVMASGFQEDVYWVVLR